MSYPRLHQDDDLSQPVVLMPPDDDGNVKRLTVQEAHEWCEAMAPAAEVGGKGLNGCLVCQVWELIRGIR